MSVTQHSTESAGGMALIGSTLRGMAVIGSTLACMMDGSAFGGGTDEHSRRAVMGMTLRDMTEIVITLGDMAVIGSTLACMAVVDSILVSMVTIGAG